MGTGIILCGLNGCGKTTLGRVVAKRLNFRALDIEHYWFPSSESFVVSRTKEEVQQLLLEDLELDGGFVLSSVSCGWGSTIESHFALAVYLSAPKDLRLERIRQRELRRFGDRVMAGGDLYESQQRFRQFVANRSEEPVRAALKGLCCPVLELDAALPVGILAKTIVMAFEHLCKKPREE